MLSCMPPRLFVGAAVNIGISFWWEWERKFLEIITSRAMSTMCLSIYCSWRFAWEMYILFLIQSLFILLTRSYGRHSRSPLFGGVLGFFLAMWTKKKDSLCRVDEMLVLWFSVPTVSWVPWRTPPELKSLELTEQLFSLTVNSQLKISHWLDLTNSSPVVNSTRAAPQWLEWAGTCARHLGSAAW